MVGRRRKKTPKRSTSSRSKSAKRKAKSSLKRRGRTARSIGARKVSGAKKSKKARRFNKKVIIIVIDGLADTPQKGQTPLSAANTPNMDWFAKNGAVGELQLLPLKQYPTSQTANVALLGFNPRNYNIKRGPLEAVGVGIPYKNGQLAVRCNFATIDKKGQLLDRRAGRDTYGLDEITRYINQQVKLPVRFVMIRTYQHRAVVILKDRLSDNIQGNDPNKSGDMIQSVKALSPAAERSAKLLQEFIDKSHDMIEYHPKNAERIERGFPPANYIIVRQAGNSLAKLPNFPKKWWLRNVAVVSENGPMKATCMLAGFNSITVPEMGDEMTLDFIFDNIESLLTEYDMVYSHIKTADTHGHDGDFKGKQAAIEAIDRKLAALKDFNGILILTCDHITSCEHKAHYPGPVPVVVYGKKKDKVQKFDEFGAKKGALGKMTGRQMWKYVFNR